MAQPRATPHQGLLVVTINKGAASSALTGQTWGRPWRPGTGIRDGVIGNLCITGQGKPCSYRDWADAQVCPYGGWPE